MKFKRINKIKFNVVQNRHFKKQYIILYSSEQIKYFSKFNNNALYNYYKKINDKNYINKNKNFTISQSEEGLNYYKFSKNILNQEFLKVLLSYFK